MKIMKKTKSLTNNGTGLLIVSANRLLKFSALQSGTLVVTLSVYHLHKEMILLNAMKEDFEDIQKMCRLLSESRTSEFASLAAEKQISEWEKEWNNYSRNN